MKKATLLCLLLCLCFLNVLCQNASELRQKMTTIRQNTDWNNKAAAKKANDEIREISRQLLMLNQMQKAPPKDAREQQQIEENTDYTIKLWKQLWEIAGNGEDAIIDLAAPLREEIVREYKDDEDPCIKNPDWLNSIPYLLINMSAPQIQKIIDQMPLFKGIKTLVITCEKQETPVDLEEILRNASDYPLEELYILNFGSAVTAIPSVTGKFSKLTTLNLMHNSINRLPDSLSELKKLKILYVDYNPVSNLLSLASCWKNLRELGIEKTGVTENEIIGINQILPDCKIITQ